MLTAFAFVAHQNDREGFWYRVHMIRQRHPDGSMNADSYDLPPAFARRLADGLCDRYGIEDRGALMCGRIFTVERPRLASAVA
jgi:hypothetical protein